MQIIDIVSKLPNRGSNGTRSLASIKFAVIHHDDVAVTGPYDALKRYASEANYHLSKPLTFGRRFAYHLKIDSSGNVYQCSPVTEVLYHAGNFAVNKAGIGICLDGDFTKSPPPIAQQIALNALLNNLCFHRPDMPLLVKATVRTHREVRISPTACPGERLQPIIAAWRSK